jgi:hypothetical protein
VKQGKLSEQKKKGTAEKITSLTQAVKTKLLGSYIDA